ncbi:unnamed protein product, partial [Prorocentrum cordatum]
RKAWQVFFAVNVNSIGALERETGWRVGIAPSVGAKGGWSAGALHATVPSVGITNGKGQWGISPPESKGRLASGALAAISKQGVAVVGSARLWVSEGMAVRNKAILRNSTSAARAAGRESVLGGDFNMGPTDLQEAGVLNGMGGITVFDAHMGSCTTMGVSRNRDYFIISKAPAGSAIAAKVQDQYNAAPCAPVLLRVPEQCEQTGMGDKWGLLGTTYEDLLSRRRNFVGADHYERRGHQQLLTYVWEALKTPNVEQASMGQKWVETLRWARRNAKGIPDKAIIAPLLERPRPAWSDRLEREVDGDAGACDGDADASGIGADMITAHRVEVGDLNHPESTIR